jgi:predicted TIM-barrel enzyme
VLAGKWYGPLYLDDLLDRLKQIGFSGIQNLPTVGLFDGIMRQNPISAEPPR